MNENLSEIYLEKLKTEKNTGLVLAKFFCELFDIPLTKEKIILFSKLVKLYSKENLYFSILDCFDIENVNTEKIYPLIVYLCKKRLENRSKEIRTDFSLSDQSFDIKKKIKLVHKTELKIISPFDKED